MFYVFRRAPHPARFSKVKNVPCFFLKVKTAPSLFLEVKNAPSRFLEVKNKLFPFLEMKSKSCPFFHHYQGKESGFLQKVVKYYLKSMCLENSCAHKQQILIQNTILFLDGETFFKRSE